MFSKTICKMALTGMYLMTPKNTFGFYQKSNPQFSRVLITTCGKKKGKPEQETIIPSQKYIPSGENQQKYVEILKKKGDKMIFALGPAGTGKTLFACITAIEQLKSGEKEKIIITRPVVSVEEDIGFLPGNVRNKMDPWIRPLLDIFEEYYKKTELEKMMLNGKIEISPLAYMRGRTFKNSFILADEMQNSTPNQMLMLTTRIGEGSTMVITGDLNQSDRLENNGLKMITEKIKNTKIPIKDEIELCILESGDIKRSSIVNKIIEIMCPTPVPSSTSSSPVPVRRPSPSPNDDAALIPKSQYFASFKSFPFTVSGNLDPPQQKVEKPDTS
jgi:phosphate starvation-inducible PhoH-like protein